MTPILWFLLALLITGVVVGGVAVYRARAKKPQPPAVIQPPVQPPVMRASSTGGASSAGAGGILGNCLIRRRRALTHYTLTLQPDAAAGVDTNLASAFPSANYATAQYCDFGYQSATNTSRFVIKFDLSSIPTTAIITSAVLSLWYYFNDGGTDSGTYAVYRQLRAWVEAEATWDTWKTGSNWTSAGGFDAADCEQTSIGQFTISDSTFGERTISLTPSAVQGWVSGALANNGMLLKDVSETAPDVYRAVRSSDYGTAAERPKLVIEYDA